MSELNLERVKQVFHQVRGETGAERERLIEELCRGDKALTERVRALLASEEDVGDFLASPTVAEAHAVALARSTSQAPSEQPGSRIGPYKLLQVIGEGGFGVVYMAEQEEPIRRRVALKVIKPGMDTKQVIARFEAERQALAMMDHPNIAKVFEAGTTPAGRPYFVMELVRGIPITDYCDEHRLDTRQRLELFADVCGAVHHANQAGIIHRDIKPSNVMVTLHDGTPVPKVIDFGVAKATHQRLTESTLFTEYNQFIGSPTYMSPEQAAYEGLDVDNRADVYSLGVLLYELLTGTTPHSKAMKRAAYVEVIRILKEEEPPKPSTRIQTMGPLSETHAEHRHADPSALAKLLRGDLDWIVMKALEKERSRRYGSAEEIAADIARYFNQLPIVARPPSAMYRARKLFRRRRGPFATAAVMLLALTLEVAYMGWQRTQAASGSTAVTMTGARQVGTWPNEFFSASISPDGRYLALSQDGPNLRVHDFTTGEARDITRGSNADMAIWSPDGTRLAYTSYCDSSLECRAPEGFSTVYELRITGLEGLESQVLYRGDDGDGVWYPAPLAWSPDGQEILVKLDRDGLGLLSVNDGSLRSLKSFDRQSGGAVFSPDGRYVVYDYASDGTTGNRDLFLIAVDGSEELQLTETPADEQVVRWSSDGTLLFRSDQSGADALFEIEVENGVPTTPAVSLRSDLGSLGDILGTTADGALYYAVRPDRGPLAYTAEFDPENAEVIGSPRRVAPALSHFMSDPAWSPDGERLAYWSQRGADRLLSIRDLMSGRETVTALDMVGRRPNVEWRQDGGALMVDGNLRGSGNGVYEVGLEEGGRPEPIPLEERGWVRRNGSAYRLEMDCGGETPQTFGTLEDRPSRCLWWYSDFVRAAIVRKDLETGRTSELYERGGRSRDVPPLWALSPDGREIVVQVETADATVLEVVSTTDGTTRRLTDLTYGGEPVRPRDGLTWTPDGRHIVFFGSRDTDIDPETFNGVDAGPTGLYRVSALGGPLEPAGLETSGAERGLGSLFAPRGAVLRPDGREVRFFASQPPVDEEGRTGWTVWVLENPRATGGEGR